MMFRASRYPRVLLLRSLRQQSLSTSCSSPVLAPELPLSREPDPSLLRDLAGKTSPSNLPSRRFRTVISFRELSSSTPKWCPDPSVFETGTLSSPSAWDVKALLSSHSSDRLRLLSEIAEALPGTEKGVVCMSLGGGLFGFWGDPRLKSNERLKRKIVRSDVLNFGVLVARKLIACGGSF